MPEGRGLNIAHEAVDRHAIGGNAGRVAFRRIGRDGARQDITYADLGALTNRFANVLGRLGVNKGDVVVTLAGRIPELYVAARGALKKRAIFSPFFSAFGPEPIRARMNIARAKVLVTTEPLYRKKVEPYRDSMPDLEHVLLVGESGRSTAVPIGTRPPPPATGAPVTNEEIKDAVLRILTKIAPEARGQTLTPTVSLRDQLDLDSMDALNFIIALHEELGVDIPEADYAKLVTLDGIVAYLAERLAERR